MMIAWKRIYRLETLKMALLNLESRMWGLTYLRESDPPTKSMTMAVSKETSLFDRENQQRIFRAMLLWHTIFRRQDGDAKVYPRNVIRAPMRSTVTAMFKLRIHCIYRAYFLSTRRGIAELHFDLNILAHAFCKDQLSFLRQRSGMEESGNAYSSCSFPRLIKMGTVTENEFFYAVGAGLLLLGNYPGIVTNDRAPLRSL